MLLPTHNRCAPKHPQTDERRTNFTRIFWLLVLPICCVVVRPQTAHAMPQATDAVTFESTVRPFLRSYCVSCHGTKTQKAERRFDRLPGNITNDNSLVDYQDILDQLNLASMPPEDAPQPSIEKRRQVIRWFTKRIAEFHRSNADKHEHPVLRRLNAREYRNTVRDLFSFNTTIFDPTIGFPRDQTVDYLDTVGETLVTSGHLLARYLDAAETVVNRAIFPLQKPTAQTWTFRDGFRQQPEIDQVHRKTNRFNHMTLYDVIGADKPEGAYGPIHAFAKGVPHHGFYEIRLKAEALNRSNPYDAEFLGTDPAEPLRLGIVAGNYLAGDLHKTQPVEPLLAEIDLADESKWYTVKVWLDKGYTPRFTFQNGLMDARNLWSRLVRKYPKQFPKKKKGGIVEVRFNAIKFGKLPQIHIHEIEIKGPLIEEWPTAAQVAALGPDAAEILHKKEITPEQMRQNLHRFGARAFRRPLHGDEVERLMKIIQARQSESGSALAAYADGLKAILCSPHFLYLNPGPATEEEATAPVERARSVAARLSYFLWSSTPDAELLALANNGALNQPDVLSRQTERLLKDTRAQAFVNGFLSSWLTLSELGATPPDRSQFRKFYHYNLDRAMREETRRFTTHLLENDLPINNFIDSKFTFVNKRLAQHYGIPAPVEPGFHKVALDTRQRGGLLGQASILTVTANGIDTSPVTRGVWLLENLLGTPPNPPPPDVEPLDPDVRGAKTIRDQLSKHRSNPACFDCHRNIDPLGFALENFDAIGRWRTTYGGKKRIRIDASGKLPDGQSFNDIGALKSILLGRQELFTRALTRKLFAYAIGRKMEARDRPAIDGVIKELEQRGNGFRTLIELVVSSELFRS